MNADQFADEISASVVAIFALAAPVMLVAAGAGLLIAILQAATQIQEQTISQTISIAYRCLQSPLLPYVDNASTIIDSIVAVDFLLYDR